MASVHQRAFLQYSIALPLPASESKLQRGVFCCVEPLLRLVLNISSLVYVIITAPLPYHFSTPVLFVLFHGFLVCLLFLRRRVRPTFLGFLGVASTAVLLRMPNRQACRQAGTMRRSETRDSRVAGSAQLKTLAVPFFFSPPEKLAYVLGFGVRLGGGTEPHCIVQEPPAVSALWPRQYTGDPQRTFARCWLWPRCLCLASAPLAPYVLFMVFRSFVVVVFFPAFFLSASRWSADLSSRKSSKNRLLRAKTASSAAVVVDGPLKKVEEYMTLPVKEYSLLDSSIIQRVSDTAFRFQVRA